jgi:hypothetical protein
MFNILLIARTVLPKFLGRKILPKFIKDLNSLLDPWSSGKLNGVISAWQVSGLEIQKQYKRDELI